MVVCARRTRLAAQWQYAGIETTVRRLVGVVDAVSLVVQTEPRRRDVVVRAHEMQCPHIAKRRRAVTSSIQGGVRFTQTRNRATPPRFRVRQGRVVVHRIPPLLVEIEEPQIIEGIRRISPPTKQENTTEKGAQRSGHAGTWLLLRTHLDFLYRVAVSVYEQEIIQTTWSVRMLGEAITAKNGHTALFEDYMSF